MYNVRALVGFVALVVLTVLAIQHRSGDPDVLELRGPPGGKPMPRMGFGTCCRQSAKGEALIASTLAYLAAGGRLIDTAQMYENHRDLATAIARSGIPRHELWITSKVRTIDTALSRDRTIAEADRILAELGLEYVDLLLLHHAKGNNASERAEQWRALLEVAKAGKARNVGVSNYDVHQLKALHATTGVLPAVVQLEFHPWVGQIEHDVVHWCLRNGVAVTAYGSLGSSSNRARVGRGVAQVAARHGVSPAALLLRWALSHRGVAVIPGATSKEHILENLQALALRFQLSHQDKAMIAGDDKPPEWKLWPNMGRG